MLWYNTFPVTNYPLQLSSSASAFTFTALQLSAHVTRVLKKNGLFLLLWCYASTNDVALQL